MRTENEKALIIINANILTMADRNYDSGYICIRDGLIVSIGEMSDYPQIDVEYSTPIINVAGASVIPGLIDCYTHIGLIEEGAGFIGDDSNETGQTVSSQLRVIDGINPMDRAFSRARENGITTVAVAPGDNNIIGGQMAVLKTCGNNIDQMMLTESVGIKASLGDSPKQSGRALNKSPQTRMANAAILRETLIETIEYQKHQYKLKDQFRLNIESELKLLPMTKVLKKEKPIFIRANRSDDIITAVRIANEFDIKIIIVQGAEASLVHEIILHNEIPIIAGPLLSCCRNPDAINQQIDSIADLISKGILIALSSSYPHMPLSLLRISAAFASNERMTANQALKTITINAARILNLDDRIGSIEIGKDADLVMFSGRPLDALSRVVYTIIDGKIVYQKAAKADTQKKW